MTTAFSIGQRAYAGITAASQCRVSRLGARWSAGAAVIEAPARAPQAHTPTLDETLPPHRVVLHNDDHNDMLHVVRALVSSVPELTAQRAVEVMLAAHNHGSAEVIVCYLERAEMYRDRLESHGLTATIERV